MTKKILLSFLIIFSVFSVSAQATDWVKSFGGPNSDKGISIDADTLGYVYISGFFNNQANFDAEYLACNPLSTFSNNKEAFLAKMDSFGNVIWALQGGDGTGGCCDDRALGMHVTPDGYSYITGTNWSGFDIGTCNLNGAPSNSSDGSILAKVDPNGNCVWLKTFGANEGAGTGPDCPYPIYDADDHSYDVKVDKDNFIYVAGFYSGLSAEFDGFTITNPTWGADCQPKGYVGKLDENGNWIWVDNYDGIKDQRGSRDSRIAIDHFSNVYVVGGFQNTGNYGPLSLTSNGEWDAFLFKMDKDGNWIWARNVGSNKTDRANGIAIDYADNIYIAGEYRNPMVFAGANASNGTDTLSHAKKRDIFVAKITTNGDWVWAKRARSKKTDKPYQMSVDDNMQVYLSGMCGDSMKFNSNLVVSNGDTTTNAFVAQLDGSDDGDWVWAKLGGGPTDDDRMGDVCEDGGNNIYAIGFFEDSADFDGYTFTSIGVDDKKDIIVWKLRKDKTVDVTPSNTIYVDVNPPGAGTINLTGTGTILTNSVNVSDFPCYQSLSDSVVQMFDAIPNAGFQFLDWDWKKHTALPNITSANTTVLTFSDDTLIVNFEVIPIDTITYIVQPAGSGTITVDATNITTFPNTTSYSGGVTSSLVATPNVGYFFSDWDFDNNTVTPNATNTNISVTWSSNDTCYVNFALIPNYNITYLTNPVSAGNIDINGINFNAFPLTQTYQQGTNVDLVANDNPNFIFSNWINSNNALTPNSNTDMVDFVAMANDTIIANYFEVDTLWVVSKPAGVASLQIENDIVTTSPYLGLYQKGTVINIEVFPTGSNVFNQWNLNDNNLPDYNASTLFTFLNSDTLYAYFNNVLAIENLGKDLKSINVYPSLVENQLTLEMLPNDYTSIQVDLLNIAGQKVQDLFSGDLNANIKTEQTFNINKSTGIYFLRIVSDKTNVVFKILKK